jgi:hypothetical protein
MSAHAPPHKKKMPHPPRDCSWKYTRFIKARVFFPDLFLEPLAKKLHRRRIFEAYFFQIGVARCLFLAAANIFTLPAEKKSRAQMAGNPPTQRVRPYEELLL